jgi:hypothetical protein
MSENPTYQDPASAPISVKASITQDVPNGTVGPDWGLYNGVRVRAKAEFRRDFEGPIGVFDSYLFRCCGMRLRSDAGPGSNK